MLPELEISLLPPDHIKGHGRRGHLIPSMESKLDKKGNLQTWCSVRTQLTREKIDTPGLWPPPPGLHPRKGPEPVHKQTGPVLCFLRWPLWEGQPQEFRKLGSGAGPASGAERDPERVGTPLCLTVLLAPSFQKMLSQRCTLPPVFPKRGAHM